MLKGCVAVCKRCLTLRRSLHANFSRVQMEEINLKFIDVVQVRPRPLPDARREGQVHGPAASKTRAYDGVLSVFVAATASVGLGAPAGDGGARRRRRSEQRLGGGAVHCLRTCLAEEDAGDASARISAVLGVS